MTADLTGIRPGMRVRVEFGGNEGALACRVAAVVSRGIDLDLGGFERYFPAEAITSISPVLPEEPTDLLTVVEVGAHRLIRLKRDADWLPWWDLDSEGFAGWETICSLGSPRVVGRMQWEDEQPAATCSWCKSPECEAADGDGATCPQKAEIDFLRAENDILRQELTKRDRKAAKWRKRAKRAKAEMHEWELTAAEYRADAERRKGIIAELVTGRMVVAEHTKDVLTVHDPDQCAGDACTVHNRTQHHMRHMPQHWRADIGLMERICDHGIGHPDPDELPGKRDSEHGCDGCCREPEPDPPTIEADPEISGYTDPGPKVGDTVQSKGEYAALPEGSVVAGYFPHALPVCKHANGHWYTTGATTTSVLLGARIVLRVGWGEGK